ncbi:hypothetical protein F4782DRAFT_495568 [Xylaria castorea]|nr:hypothetical protein F4782DRAFT_495568 [Xylaria castorea]
MAIHSDVPGLEVTVRCNEEPLHELEDPNAHDSNDASACPLTTKYIECVDDTEFDITVKVSSNYKWGYRNHVLVSNTYVDGNYVQGHIIRSPGTDCGHKYCVKGQEMLSSSTGLWFIRKFKFTTVKTVDDTQKERVERDLKVAKKLGTIEVQFYRKIEYGPIPYSGTSDAKLGALELAEKSIKGEGISHGTSYGGRETVRTPVFYDVRKIAEDDGPILIIRFVYRSRDALKRELIIPRSPSPTLENLTPAERDRLARERLDELREMKVKRENMNPTIKREFGEIIDLTEDAPARPAIKKTRLENGTQVHLIDLTED